MITRSSGRDQSVVSFEKVRVPLRSGPGLRDCTDHTGIHCAIRWYTQTELNLRRSLISALPLHAFRSQVTLKLNFYRFSHPRSFTPLYLSAASYHRIWLVSQHSSIAASHLRVFRSQDRLKLNLFHERFFPPFLPLIWNTQAKLISLHSTIRALHLHVFPSKDSLKLNSIRYARP